MTLQEKIREGMAGKLWLHECEEKCLEEYDDCAKCPVSLAKADEILSYLHSRRCRIEVERELPNNPHLEEALSGFGQRAETYSKALGDMLKWHNDSLEPLIGASK